MEGEKTIGRARPSTFHLQPPAFHQGKASELKVLERMVLKRVLSVMWRLENAMKKRKRTFDEGEITNSVET